MIGQIMLTKGESISPEEAALLFHAAFPMSKMTDEYLDASFEWQSECTMAGWRREVTQELREI